MTSDPIRCVTISAIDCGLTGFAGADPRTAHALDGLYILRLYCRDDVPIPDARSRSRRLAADAQIAGPQLLDLISAQVVGWSETPLHGTGNR